MKIFIKSENGYRFNRLLFFIPIFILIIIFLFLCVDGGMVTHPYVVCEQLICSNPLHGELPECDGFYCPPIVCEEEWCEQEFLTYGEYGKTSPPIAKNFMMVGFFLILLSFIFNHVFYNRNVKFSIPSKRRLFPDWLANLIIRIFPNFKNEIDFKKVKFEDEGDEK